MNAVEIEQAITDLAERPFDPAEFPYAFLEAFGNKATTIQRLRSGATNKSDLGGVLQTNNIHILTCDAGQVTKTLAALKTSPATTKAKARFIVATDGADFEAEDLTSGETVACAFKDFPDHFGFFLPLAGISTVRQISENAFDIRATSRLNRLYVELLKDNPAWGTAERRHDMNHFMARLIFCFFAEDTDIFVGKGRFTETVAQMSARDSSNTHEVLATLFRAMNTKREDRAAAKIPRWAEDFPYVNGQLFSGGDEVPRFSKIARSYLLHVGGLDWTKINPDIFGSMIQSDHIVQVVAAGVVEPVSEEIKIGSEIDGKLKQVLVKEGSRVARGQVIAILENGDAAARVELAKAGLAEREAALARLLNGSRLEERREARAGIREAEAVLCSGVDDVLEVIEPLGRSQASRPSQQRPLDDLSTEELAVFEALPADARARVRSRVIDRLTREHVAGLDMEALVAIATEPSGR